MDAQLRARSEAVANLKGNPAVLAIVEKWLAAHKNEPSLSIWFHVSPLEPLYFRNGGSHTANIQALDIVNDVQSTMSAKVPDMSLAVAPSGCDVRQPAPVLDAKVVMHEGVGNTTLRAGNTVVPVVTITYDVDVVACYEDERVPLASVKERPMPLHENYTVRSDPGSAAAMAYQEMDRAARLLVEGTFLRALGL